MTASGARERAEALAALIGAGRYDLTRETRCHADIETLLAMSLPREAIGREVRLGPGERLDFMVGGVGVEVKLLKSASRAESILRQLDRYAAHERVEALILATNKAVDVPGEIGGKPLVTVSLGRAWL